MLVVVILLKLVVGRCQLHHLRDVFKYFTQLKVSFVTYVDWLY